MKIFDIDDVSYEILKYCPKHPDVVIRDALQITHGIRYDMVLDCPICIKEITNMKNQLTRIAEEKALNKQLARDGYITIARRNYEEQVELFYDDNHIVRMAHELININEFIDTNKREPRLVSDVYERRLYEDLRDLRMESKCYRKELVRYDYYKLLEGK